MSILNIHDYEYPLPSERIALYPLEKRDESKLLIYKQGKITHTKFHSLVDFLPNNSFLFFNNTKVIPARLHFHKETGADIEVFLLNPIKPSILLQESMQAKKECIWHCTIGNLKRWSNGLVLKKEMYGITLETSLEDKEKCIVKFKWQSHHSFAEIVQMAGEMEELCRKSPIPVAFDEELIGKHTIEDKQSLLQRLKPQFIILKPTLLGGFQQCTEWIEIAQNLQIGWWITSALESNIGLNAICQFAANYPITLPQGLGTGQIYSNNFNSPLTVNSGTIFYDRNGLWDEIV